MNDTKQRADPRLEIAMYKVLSHLAARLKEQKQTLENCGSLEQIEALAQDTVQESLEFSKTLMRKLDHDIVADALADHIFNEMSDRLVPRFKALLINFKPGNIEKFIDQIAERCNAKIAELEDKL